MVPPCCQLTVFILAAFAGGSCALPLPAPSDLRIEHLGGVGAAPVGLEAAGGPLRLWWALPSAPRALVQRAYELQLAQEGGWQASSQTIETSQSEAVPLPAGMDKLQADSAYAVRVRWWATSGPVGPNLEPSQWSQWLNFTTGLPTPEDWGGAAWLAAANSSRGDAASQLRTTFELDAVGSLEKVHLYVGSRGYYKCWINGHSASDHEQGHTTTFEVRTLYDTFVVSPELLQAGTNALGCTIAQGWYGDSSGGAMSDFVHTKSLILKLSLRYRNGTRASVLSSMADKGGRRWMAATGPWVRAKIFKGVSYDARQETPGWTTAEYSTAGSAVPWATAREDATAAPQMVLRSAMTPLIRHTQSFPAVNFTRVPQPDSGATQAEKALVAAAPSYSYLYDFGQNAAAQISIHVPPGALLLDGMTPTQTDAVVTFSLKFAETDQKGEGESGGSPITYVSTLGKIAAGGIDWQAHFTYYGFQFCTLTVSSNDSTVVLPAPTIDTLVSHFTHSDVDHGLSGIEFSRPLLNTIQRMTLYASKSNLLDVPTDCPTVSMITIRSFSRS
jgi:alpha-L-rhamnosidase